MKLYKAIVQQNGNPLGEPTAFQELYLPEDTIEGQIIVIKTPETSQICKVLHLIKEESVVINK